FVIVIEFVFARPFDRLASDANTIQRLAQVVGYRVIERSQLLVGSSKLFVERTQFIPSTAQLVILQDGGLVGGEQQIEYLATVGGDQVFLTAERDLQSGKVLVLLVMLPVRQYIHYAGEEVFLAVGFGKEVVSAAFQSADNILRVVQRGQEDHRHVAGIVPSLDVASELVAVHLRHDDIADNQSRFLLLDLCKGRAPVAGDRNAVMVLFQNITQLLCLREAILYNQNVLTDFIGCTPATSHHCSYS